MVGQWSIDAGSVGDKLLLVTNPVDPRFGQMFARPPAEAAALVAAGTHVDMTGRNLSTDPVFDGPVPSTLPTLTVTYPGVGGTASIQPGVWPTNVNLSGRWFRDGVLLEGYYSFSLQFSPEDVGKLITAQVVARMLGQGQPTVSSFDPIGPIDQHDMSRPYLDGDEATISMQGGAPVQVGNTAVSDLGGWTNYDRVEYQWLWDGDPIEGARESTLILTEDLVGEGIGLSIEFFKGANGVNTLTNDLGPVEEAP